MTFPEDRQSDETAFVEVGNGKGGLKRLHNGLNRHVGLAGGAVGRRVLWDDDPADLAEVMR
jgi:hypothetical protein